MLIKHLFNKVTFNFSSFVNYLNLEILRSPSPHPFSPTSSYFYIFQKNLHKPYILSVGGNCCWSAARWRLWWWFLWCDKTVSLLPSCFLSFQARPGCCWQGDYFLVWFQSHRDCIQSIHQDEVLMAGQGQNTTTVVRC